MSTIQIAVREKDTLAPCWIEISDSAGHSIRDHGTKNIPGFPSSGRVSIEIPPGEYRLRAHRGPGYRWIDARFVLADGQTQSLEFQLEPIVDMHKRGWFCGDIHNHPRGVTPAELVRFLEAREVDYLSICQGWLVNGCSYRGHDGEALAAYLSSANTTLSRVKFGAEYPKTRYGHVCWFSIPPLSDPHGIYDDFHDSVYFNAEPCCNEPLAHPSRGVPFKNETNFSKMVRMKKRGGVSMAPHPTSWWLDKPTQKIITTNISADFVLSLFAGKLYDTLTVMGYDAEHIFYQNFWFELLNRGHKIVGVAETDGDLTSAHSIGHLRCYSHTGSDEFDLNEYLTAVKSGRTFMTSGPLLFVRGDETVFPGGSLQTGRSHTLSVEAFADANPSEYLTWLVLYRNGKVAELIDVEREKSRELRHTFHLPAETERAWYVVKIYGSTRPQRREFADVMAYAERCRHEKHDEYKQIRQVAFSNPFYVEPPEYREPEEIRPALCGRVVCSQSGKPVQSIVHVLREGFPVAEAHTDAQGRFELTMALSDELEIESRSHKCATRNIPVHFAPIADLLDEIIAGRWALDGNVSWQPGQVPFEAFQYDRLRDILSKPFQWEIALEPRG